MPLYEYLCDSCGHRFEVIQKFSDPPVDLCPKCGARVQKVLSSPAFHFKGSGWYITDYARKPQTEASKTAEKSGDKSDAEKAEAQPKSGDGSPAASPSSTAPSSSGPSSTSSSKDS